MIRWNFVQSDLGNRTKGDVLEVTLTSGANVRLLDSYNFARYKRGEQHQFFGGLAKQSPIRIPIPSSGHWYAVVDMQGLRGSTKASFRVINAAAMRPLPAIPNQTALSQRRPDLAGIADNLLSEAPEQDAGREFDVFVSYASEDKDAVARPLALGLQSLGLAVWFDEFELRIGDSLRRKIDAGIARSRFGVVVLSKPFFAKGWSQYELDGLVTMAVSGKQVLLPLWHNISKDEVIQASPSLADKIALRTSDYGIDEIAAEIAAVVSTEARDSGG
jgi:hypothetical protein